MSFNAVKSNARYWRPIDRTELQAFIRLLIQTGVNITSLYTSEYSDIHNPEDATKALYDKPTHHLRMKFRHGFFDHKLTQEDLNTAAKYGRFS